MILKEVTVEAEKLWEKDLTHASQVGVEQLQARDIKQTPAAFDDVLRAIQIKSGISSSGDYSGYFSVRGGNENQNLVVVDGTVIANPYRFRAAFGAGFSDINPATVDNVYLHLGGYSAQYGNALSSVLEVDSRIGNDRHFGFRGSVNLTDMSGHLEGPLPGLKGSYLVSVRRTYYDFLANKLAGDDSSFPFFFELAGRLAFDLGNKNKFVLSLKRSREGAELKEDVSDQLNLNEKSKTRLVSLIWKSFIRESWQTKTVISYYDDETEFSAFEITEGFGEGRQDLNSRAEHLAINEDFRYRLAEHSWLDFGVHANFVSSEVDFLTEDAEFIYARREFPNNINFDGSYEYYAAYLENSSKLNEWLHLRAGLRYDYSTLIQSGNFGPRFSAWVGLDDMTEVDASWGLIYQYPDPLDIYTRDPAVNLGINLDNLVAEKATHYVVGLKRRLTSTIDLKLDVYYKELDRLLLPRDDEFFFPQNSGIGLSRGIEVKVENKTSGQERLSGFISYALGDSKFREVTGDEWIPFKFDRRHSLKAFANVRLFGNWRATLLWQVATGLAFTDVIGAQTRSNGTWQYIQGPRNGANFPPYHRLDARLSYQHSKGRRSFSFYLDFFNITNRQNVFDIIWEQETVYEEDRTLRFAKKRTFYMLPFVPSFGVSFSY